MSRLLILLLAMVLCQPLAAQNSKKVKGMKKQQTTMQKNIKKNEKALSDNKKAQRERERQIAVIEGQIQTRANHIHSLEGRIDSVERGIATLEHRLDSLRTQLEHKKARYAHALRYARTQRLELSPTVFVLAGNTPSEMLRRARYAKQYATYQRRLGEAVMAKRTEALNMQHQLLLKKDELNRLLQDIIAQRRQLNADRQRQQDVLHGLVKEQKSIDETLKKQRREMAELERKIEERIAYEIEQARKKAEEEQRRREAEARKRAAKQGGGGKGGGTAAAPARSQGGKQGGGSKGSWMTSEDRALNGSFEQNKGRLPVPITGDYMVTRRFGPYTPEGMKGVTLDNKGIDYTARNGNARARAVFDGVVSAVVEVGGSKHVLVRHGAYISIYINLSTVIVTKGQKVRARDLLGAVGRDAQGHYTMQFQLRRERTLLNPAHWIAK